MMKHALIGIIIFTYSSCLHAQSTFFSSPKNHSVEGTDLRSVIKRSNEAEGYPSSHNFRSNRGGDQTLDSIKTMNPDSNGVLQNATKLIYTYDTQERVSEELEQNWNGNQWEDILKKVYTYNAANQVVNYTEYIFSSGQWAPVYKWDATFNSNGDQTSYTPLIWDGSQWVPNEFFYLFKTVWTYNTNNELVLTELFHGENGNWVTSLKTEFNYNASSNLIMHIDYNWDVNQWMPTNKSEYAYNALGQRIEREQFFWEDNQWKSSYLHSYAYNTAGQETDWLEKWWYDIQWNDSRRSEKFYDQNGNKIEENHYSWFDTFWEPYLSLEIAYDSMGNSVSSSNNWAWNGSSWGFGDGYQSTFDLSVDSNNVIDPYWIGGSKILTNEGSSWVNNAWQLNFSSTYFYSGGFPSSVNDQFGKDQRHFVKVFPNPASDVLMLQMQDELFDRITVFDLQGHLRLSSTVHLNKSIPLNDLTNGIYFYQLSSSSGKLNYGKFEVVK